MATRYRLGCEYVHSNSLQIRLNWEFSHNICTIQTFWALLNCNMLNLELQERTNLHLNIFQLTTKFLNSSKVDGNTLSYGDKFVYENQTINKNWSMTPHRIPCTVSLKFYYLTKPKISACFNLNKKQKWN